MWRRSVGRIMVLGLGRPKWACHVTNGLKINDGLLRQISSTRRISAHTRDRSSSSVATAAKAEQSNDDKEDDAWRAKESVPRRMFWQTMKLLAWTSVAYMFLTHVGSVGTITGPSMSPTINPSLGDRDVVLLNRSAYDTFLLSMIDRVKQYRWIKDYFPVDDMDEMPFKVGDVVLLIAPFDPHRMTCKRILALAGEYVTVADDNAKGSKKKRIRVPHNHVWVEGDVSATDDPNSIRASRDSRTYGPVHIALIRSRVDAILWPPARFGMMPPRPGFDTARAQEAHRLRQKRTRYARHPHPDDSTLTPFVEWDSTTSSSKGLDEPNDLQRHIEKTLTSAAEEKRQKEREERMTALRQMWNRSSRGGRLGDDAEA